MIRTTTIAAAAVLLAVAGSADAAALYTKSGAGSMGNPGGWVGSTNQSTIFEVRFDYTAAAVASSDPVMLWEAGGGTGSSVVLNGANITYAINGDADTAAHGLAGPLSDVQVVTLIDVTNDLQEIYVNGVLVSPGTTTQNTWSGSDSGNLGIVASQIGGSEPSGTVSYPDAENANFSFAVYLLADNDLNDILVAVPEPASVALVGVGGLLIAGRRRRS